MGRLFWKFFLFIWLGQVAAVLGTGTFFWFERQRASLQAEPISIHPAEVFDASRPPPQLPDRPAKPAGHHPPGSQGPKGPFPIFPLFAGLIASLLCAAGLAWYFAKPIRHLRHAFGAAAEGKLDVRIGQAMGGRQDELVDLGHEFDRMTERLQDLVIGQKRLLHDVSHELRSPLARLQAAIGLARQQPARLADSLTRIEREGERMNGLIGELLTLSRLEAGVSVPLERVDLGELLAGIAEDALFEGSARQIDVLCALEPELCVRANPELLHRAIENIVRNGVRFSPVGGELRLEAGAQPDGKIRLSISDQGIGVPESEREAIFTPFHRGGNPSTGDGCGLGLAIARQVISALNGSVVARQRPDDRPGLLIEIILPAA